MLTVVNKDGTFSGIQYKEVKQEYIDHHVQYGQKLIWLERPVNQQIDEEGNTIIETASEDEMKNIIESAEQFDNSSIWKKEMEATMAELAMQVAKNTLLK